MKKLIAMLCLIVLSVSLVACGDKELQKANGQIKPNKNVSEAVQKTKEKGMKDLDKDVTNKAEELDEVTTEAMCVLVGDWLLFINENGPFTLVGEKIEYVDVEGNAITETDLQTGNKVEILSSGIMMESYPGQLANVTKVTVTDIGSPEDASEYQEIIDELSQSGMEATTFPVMNINYKNELADVTVAVEANGSSQLNTGTDTIIADVLPITGKEDYMPVANIGTSVDMTITFTDEAMSIWVSKWNAEDDTEEIPVEKSGSTYVLKDVTTGIYSVYAEFANGDAEYRFVCEE